jgi:hypothetical protein
MKKNDFNSKFENEDRVILVCFFPFFYSIETQNEILLSIIIASIYFIKGSKNI